MSNADPVADVEQAADAALAELTRLQEELVDRETRLQGLREACEQRDGVIAQLSKNVETLQRAADERAQVIAKLDDALKRARQVATESRPAVDVDAVRAQLEERLREIDRVTRERDALALRTETAARALEDERLRAMIAAEQREAELLEARREAELLRARVQSLSDTLVSRGEIIAALQAACDERLALIQRLSRDLESQQAVLEQSHAGGASADEGVDWRAIAQERESALASLSAEAEHRAVLLAEVTAALQDRTREVEDLRRRRART